MIVTMNNFSFNNEHYLQNHGTAMGTYLKEVNKGLSTIDPHSLKSGNISF